MPSGSGEVLCCEGVVLRRILTPAASTSTSSDHSRHDTIHLFFDAVQRPTLHMAPTKKDAEKGEKEAKLTPEQSSSLIIDYLHKQNRPYSAIDISSNLKNRVSKAAAQKLLKDLHERNQIAGQAAGKQIVYHAIQVWQIPPGWWRR